MDFNELEQLIELLKKHGVVGFKNDKYELRIDLYHQNAPESQVFEEQSSQEDIKEDFSSYSQEDEEQFLFPKG